MLYKICPVCKEKNSVNMMMCINCLSNISHIQPSTNDKNSKNICILKNSDFTIELKPNDIVGREQNGAEYLNRYPTVSRKHCKFLYEDNKWFIQDLNSTNKTYLNQKSIIPLEKTEIKKGDEISLSKSLVVKVEI